ncbi:MAG: hypothetical protein P1S46_04560 [bacterium]|nr:hypothetical protein [bacterium]MDT8394818.1 hypothetical protein [bacterium]
MAETGRGTVVLRSVPSKDVEMKVALYLTRIYREVPPTELIALIGRTKPLTIVTDVTSDRGKALADAINGLGASAYFLQYLNSQTRH